jgi:WD40 repeat protein
MCGVVQVLLRKLKSSDQRKPSQRFQFRLRSLFTAFAFVAVALSWWMHNRIQLEHIAELERQIVILEGPHLLGHFPQRRPAVLKTGPNAFAAFRDGSRVVCANGTVVEVWEMTTGQKVISIEHPELVLGISVSPDEQRVVTITAGADAPARGWSLQDGSLVREYSRSTKTRPLAAAAPWPTLHNTHVSRTGFGFTAIVFSPTGRQIAAGCEDGSILLFDTRTAQEMARLSGNAWRIRRMAFSPDGTKIVAASGDYAVTLWDIGTGTLLREFHDPRPPGWDKRTTPVVFSPDGATFAFYCSGWPTDVTRGESRDLSRGPVYQFMLCDGRTGKLVKRLGFINRCPVNIAFLPDGRLLADFTNTLRLWDITTGQEECRHTCNWIRELRHIAHLPAISAVMAVATENGEDTLHEDWTSIAIVPYSSFQEIPEVAQP